jgi:hypothetical protein
MRHHVDLYLISLRAPLRMTGNIKQIAFNDWYRLDGRPGGTVQSFGRLPPAPMIAAQLEAGLRDGPIPWLAPVFRWLGPAARLALARKRARSLVLASIVEDPPRTENLVRPGSAGEAPTVILYRMDPRDVARIDAFRRRVRALFKPFGVTLVAQAECNRHLAHACGTCRFGADPEDNVLDPDNRAHDLDNLYVVDSSFFPSSGGTNPGLTIAANALRVAARLGDRLGARPRATDTLEPVHAGVGPGDERKEIHHGS